MEEYNHEQVKREHNLPAMIAVLEAKDVDRHFSKDVFIPSHWHRSLEISLIENAEAVLQMDSREYCIKDDFTCINSGVVHSLHAKTIQEDSRCIIVLFSYEFMKTAYPHIDQVHFDLSLNKDHHELKQLYKKLEKYFIENDDYSYLNINACLLEIFSLLLREYKIDNIKNSSYKGQYQIKDILTYLHSHYQEPLTLSEISTVFCMSQEHFSRQFHHYVGKTYKDYLMNYRLYKAYEDLIHTDKTVQDIARIHGFLNVKSFIKVFKDHYKETPLQYRKKMSRN